MTGSASASAVRPGLFTPQGRAALRAGIWLPGAPAALGAAGTGMVLLGWLGLIGGFVLTNIHNRRRAAGGSGNADA